LNTFLILIPYYSKMLESSEYEDTEFEDDFDDNLDEFEETED
jgi:hypothetical protein